MKNTILTPILLPTEDASNLGINPNDIHNKPRLYIHEYPIRCEKHHLYLCSTLPIKEGDWYLVELFKITGESDGLHLEKCTKIEDVWCNNYDVVQTRHKDNCKKIILTTDPKLIANGVPAIDGNTKAIIKVDFTEEYSEEHEVNFLEEFCKRWNKKGKKPNVSEMKEGEMLALLKKVTNQKDNQKDGYDEWMEMVGNQKVNMEKLTEEGQKTDAIIDLCFKKSGIAPKHKEVYGIGVVDGYNQALQFNAGGFSLEDMRKAYQAGMDYMDLLPEEAQARGVKLLDKEEYIQSLTKEQPKGDIVIECEMELTKWSEDKGYKIGEKPTYKIKLNKDGQPTLIFK